MLVGDPARWRRQGGGSASTAFTCQRKPRVDSCPSTEIAMISRPRERSLRTWSATASEPTRVVCNNGEASCYAPLQQAFSTKGCDRASDVQALCVFWNGCERVGDGGLRHQ